MENRRALVVAAALGGLVLTACEQPATTAGAAVVAKVGGEVVSEAELRSAMARLGPLGAAESAQARDRVLEALIDQQLVSEAARNAKLDRQPEVALALRQAQRQVLVDAYMERLFRNLTPPSDAEIRDYYARHPELFGARKLYRVQELELQLAPERFAEVEARLKQSRNLAEFSAWLDAEGIGARTGAAVRAAEQLPPQLLSRLVGMQAGQVAMVPAGEGRVSVLQLLGSQAQPVALEQARGTIERILLGEKRKTLLEAEIRKLRSSGRVEYASGFAPAAPPTGQAGKP